MNQLNINKNIKNPKKNPSYYLNEDDGENVIDFDTILYHNIKFNTRKDLTGPTLKKLEKIINDS